LTSSVQSSDEVPATSQGSETISTFSDTADDSMTTEGSDGVV
jgi:hypothetical protein